LWSELEGEAERWYKGKLGKRDPETVPWEEMKKAMSLGPFKKAKSAHALLTNPEDPQDDQE
jgi:hypothetical protein